MNRITVMLVDDEPLALENVYDLIPWGEHGFEVIAQTTDSRKAWQLFQKLRAHIVIMDISMPHMDGLELGRKIHELEPRTQLLYLTAYRDFDYARQALELRASNYLLKHEISRNRLLDELLIIKQGLESKVRDWNSSKRQIVRDLVLGKKQALSERLETTVFKEVWHQMQGTLAILYFEPELMLHLNGQKVSSLLLKDETLWTRVKAAALRECETLTWIDAFSVEEYGYMLLLQLPAHNSFLYVWNAVQRFVQILQKELQEEGTSPSICVSLQGTREKFHSTYVAMKELYNHSFFLPPKSTFVLEQAGKVEDYTIQVREAVRQIGDALQHNNSSLLQDHLQALFDNLIMPTMNDRGLLQAVKELGALLVERYNQHEQQSLGADAVSIVSSLKGLLEDIMEGQPSQHSSYSRWVTKAIEYVKANYDDPGLSLESVAEYLQISSIHLRTTFKKETGISLLDYTTEYRVEKAKELLKQGNFKIYTISEMVGYKTSQYFSQVFKKMTGVHPKDYM
jgi:two-component system response regulator YesN